MTNNAWVIFKDFTTILVVSGSTCPVVRSDPNGATKQYRINQLISNLPDNLLIRMKNRWFNLELTNFTMR